VIAPFDGILSHRSTYFSPRFCSSHCKQVL